MKGFIKKLYNTGERREFLTGLPAKWIVTLKGLSSCAYSVQ